MIVFFFKLFAYALVALASATLLAVLNHRFRQRSLRKIPGPPNSSFFWGHWLHMFDSHAYTFYEELFRTYGQVARVSGFLGDIQLVVSDPMACNNIMKDQAVFEATEVFLSSTMQVFGPVVFATTGAHRRRQRKLITPTFNVNHMRNLIPIFYGVSRQLRDKLDSIVETGPQEINIADWTARLALELIGQAGFGYSFGILEGTGRNNEFCRVLGEWMPALSSLAVYQNLFPYVYKVFHPNMLKFMGRLVPWPKLHHVIDIAEAMNTQARGVYEAKKRFLESDASDDAAAKQVGEGKDLISLLMHESAAVSEDDRLSDEEVAAQVMGLIVAGTESTSCALSRVLHLLALHPDVQDKLRKELKEAFEDNEELAHDHLVSLPFLEAVCRESLRLYPPLPGVMRTTQSDTILPLSTPIHDVDGREIHEVFVPANTDLVVQIHHLNRDPSIWGSDAAEWKPERWLAPLPESVVRANIQGLYSNTLTFMGGGRSCIGFRFAQLEIKVMLSQIIPAFRLAPTKAKIVWRFGVVASPSVEGSLHLLPPKLPIMVSRV